jgi:hypothetical protein
MAVTPRVGACARQSDHRDMASLPALPRFLTPSSPATDRAQPDVPPTIHADPAEAGDLKLQLARRLQAEDRARRTTSVPPPSPPVRQVSA